MRQDEYAVDPGLASHWAVPLMLSSKWWERISRLAEATRPSLAACSGELGTRAGRRPMTMA
ncbi:hypothetical protein ACRJ4B_10445 [Streptomyces sp. GTA36]